MTFFQVGTKEVTPTMACRDTWKFLIGSFLYRCESSELISSIERCFRCFHHFISFLQLNFIPIISVRDLQGSTLDCGSFLSYR